MDESSRAGGDPNYTLVFSYYAQKEKTTDLVFYELNVDGGKILKRIPGGEVFLSYKTEG